MRALSKVVAVAGAFLACGALFMAKAPAQTLDAARFTLIDAPGRAAVEHACGECHSPTVVLGGGGRTRQQWARVIGNMVALPEDQYRDVLNYLATNYPSRGPTPLSAPRPMNVSFSAWPAPHQGA